jgi:hypothetical protein
MTAHDQQHEIIKKLQLLLIAELNKPELSWTVIERLNNLIDTAYRLVKKDS